MRQQLPILTCSALLFGASTAQAGNSNTGIMTFSPSAVSATAVPMLGSTLLILLSLLLVFIAFVAFRKRQNGAASVIAGALVLAALATAGGGATLFHKAYAQAQANLFISNPAGQELNIKPSVLNIYTNASGVPMTIEAPFFTSTECKTTWAEESGACVVGAELADGAECQIDCENPDPSNWEGSWQLTCDLDSWDAPTLCATCAPDGSSVPSIDSCATCTSETFTNEDGTLVCAD